MNKHPPNAHSLFKQVLRENPRKPGQEIRAWSKAIRSLWLDQLKLHHLLPAKGTNS